MNRHEAKSILEGYRPGRDKADARVTAALQLVAKDPVLETWWTAQLRFDDVMSAAVEEIPVPADLKQSLLAPDNVVSIPFKPKGWRVTGHWRRGMAAAAAVILAMGVTLFVLRPRGTFAEFREGLIAHDWAGDPHLDLETSELSKIKAYLAARHVNANFTVPPGLSGLHLQGCRVVERAGKTVSVLCLVEGPRHLHLFVLDHSTLAGLPPRDAPDFERCGGWKTASWRHGDQTYILTGMKFHTFVLKFRKAGRWMMFG